MADGAKQPERTGDMALRILESATDLFAERGYEGTSVQAIADAVGLPQEEFEDKYTRKIGARRSLKEFSNGDCVFFDNQTRKCEVYHARPRQCKTWPFWDSNLRTPEDWERTCEECPGSGTGKLHQLDEIEDRRKTVKI